MRVKLPTVLFKAHVNMLSPCSLAGLKQLLFTVVHSATFVRPHIHAAMTGCWLCVCLVPCSFGVIMWELWTGQEPFEGVHLHALLHQLSTAGGLSLPVPGSPDWGEEMCPAEPGPGWSALMQQCWLPPEERPTSRQLVQLLDTMMDTLRSMRRSSSAQSPSVAARQGLARRPSGN